MTADEEGGTELNNGAGVARLLPIETIIAGPWGKREQTQNEAVVIIDGVGTKLFEPTKRIHITHCDHVGRARSQPLIYFSKPSKWRNNVSKRR